MMPSIVRLAKAIANVAIVALMLAILITAATITRTIAASSAVLHGLLTMNGRNR